METVTTERRQAEKHIVAKSKAEYRGVTIMETQDGCVFFLGKLKYDCANLDEAVAAIDAIYMVLAQK